MTQRLDSGPNQGCFQTAELRPPSRPALKALPLLSFVEAAKVTALFKVLANGTRIRLLHHLVRSGEANVTDLAKTVGMKMPAVSNQLQRLSDTGILSSRRDGTNVYYRVVKGCIPPILDLALCLMADEGYPPSAGGGRHAEDGRRGSSGNARGGRRKRPVE